MAALRHLAEPRLLFYAVNGLGLGHVTRLLAIARSIRAQLPGAQMLFVTTTDADSVIHREGFASVKIPSRTVVQDSRLRPSTYNKLAHTVVMNTVAAFNPAILIADTFPAGATQELMPTLSWEMRRVFVYRAQQSDRAREPFFQSALGHYHLGIVPHEEGSEDIPAPPELRLAWTGPILIRQRDEALGRDEARERLGLPIKGNLLYVTVGGGGDDEMALAEVMIFDAARSAGWSVVAPEAPLLKSRLPGVQSAHPDHRISYYPMAECFAAFDAAVSAAGYNTVHELLHFGVPSVLIPRARGLDDQFARAERAKQAGAAMVSTLDRASLEQSLRTLADDDALRARMADCASATFPENGAALAAREILALL
jgi:UDP-N-acetylglucosamine--N-acetylmuramyl-(pentapeptide) pyrophosphoryl-undecaprenol N-acetylglucosamine transferase